LLKGKMFPFQSKWIFDQDWIVHDISGSQAPDIFFLMLFSLKGCVKFALILIHTFEEKLLF